MKKYLKLLFVAIFASMSFAFVACGDDEDDEPDNGSNGNTNSSQYDIIGTWEQEQEVEVIIPGLIYSDKVYVRFNNDGSYILLELTEGYDDVVTKGTWEQSGKNLTITTMGIPVKYQISDYSKNSFKLKLNNVESFVRYNRVSDSVMDQYL